MRDGTGTAATVRTAVPNQRGSIADVDIPLARAAAGVTTGSGLRRWGRGLEFASTSLLGLGTVLAAPYHLVALMALGMWLVGAYYPVSAVTTPLREELRVVTVAALVPMALLALGSATLVLQPQELRHGLLSVALPAGFAMAIRGLRTILQPPVRVVAVGDRAFVAKAVTRLPRRSRSRVVAAIVVEDQLPPDEVPQQILGAPSYADLGRIAGVVADHGGDLVLVDSGRDVSGADLRGLSWALEGTQVALGVTGVLSSVAPHRLKAGRLGRDSVLDVRPPRPSRLVRSVKSMLDRVFGLAALVLASPLLLLTVLAVRCDSHGPAIFRQTRVGKHGKTFEMYKLRTMVVDAEERKNQIRDRNEAGSVLFKVRQDPRVTRLGCLLRRSSLDELPQLVNVVRGEMSLVGPRPHLPEEVALMDVATQRRQAVLPGMTGIWQVSGRSDLQWSDARELDTQYADNWSLSSDAVILARTVGAVLSQRGAY